MTIALDKNSLQLLIKIYKSSPRKLKGTNALKFRADNYENVDLIDSLESNNYIFTKSNNYIIGLIGLLEVSTISSEAESFLYLYDHLFKFIKLFYINHPGSSLYLDELSKLADVPRSDVNIGLSCMTEAPIANGNTSNFHESKDANITPIERILRYNSFYDVIVEMKTRRTENNVKKESTYEYTKESQLLNKTLVNLLHHKVTNHALEQYNNGHYREAVLNSIMAVFDLIREKTNLNDDGDKLIGKAFSVKNPYLVISELDSDSGRNKQIGFMQIYKGTFQGIRNPIAHSLQIDFDEISAAQYMIYASLLAKHVDESKTIRKNNNDNQS